MIRSADVGLVYSSPATAATAAMSARTPYVLLVQDLWPDSIFATGHLTHGVGHYLGETSLTWFTAQAYRRAAHIAVISPGMRECLIERGVPARKVSVVYNWVDEKVMQPTEPDPHFRACLGLTDEFVLMYAGNHGPAQALDVVLRAMSHLRDAPDVHLVLVGDGVEKGVLRSLSKRLGLTTVHFIDPVSPARIPALMAVADLQLVSLADQDLFRITLPSKVQSILACGQPILSCAPGDAARVVENSGAGFTVASGNSFQLAAEIRRAFELPRARLIGMGRAGYEYYGSTMSEAINARTLAGLLRNAAQMSMG